VARYRSKSEDDLVWNRIRRQITRDLDTAIANWREETLNNLLDPAWEEYTKRVATGELKQLEAKYSKLVQVIVADLAMPPELEDLAVESREVADGS
jgi:hypothetical protein